MKKKRGMAVAAALTLSMAMSVSALAASPSDISGHWAKGTITQWTSKGYISGYPDGTFKPDNSITRAEFVVLVNKAMGYTKKGNAYFRDVNINYWGYDEIQKGVSAGYVKGDPDGSFRPNDSVTRQEAAVMISKILDLETNFTSAATYNDYRYIPSWSVGYVGAVSNAKIMAGYPDGSFKADRVLSRAEAVIALDKVLNYDGKSDNKDDDKETKEDYTLEKTSLKDMTIKGDLVISSSLKSKAVSLDNVTVKGTLIVKGGGTITADDCDIKNLEMNYADATFKTKGDTEVKNTTFLKVGKLEGKGYDSVSVDKEFSDKITIDASINEFTLDAETDLRLLSSTVIKSFTATKNADRATINFSSAEVKDMDIYDKIKITGKGDIKTMTVYVSGVTSSIKPDDLNRKNGADKPDYTSSSSSSGSSSSSKYDNLTASKDKNGGKYNNVKVTKDGVELKNMTIYGNLTIDKDVKDGDVTLDDVTIKGNVYVNAGAKNTISFEDCEINGNIYARKTYGSSPVGLSFDSNSASNFDGTLVIEDNGAIVTGSSIAIGKIKISTDEKVEINANVSSIEVTTKTTKLSVLNGKTVNTLTINSSAKNSDITLNGTVKTLNASGDTKLSGSGTVEKIGGNGTVTNGGNITVKVETVTLNKTALALKVGNTEKLIATVKPDKATNKTVTWTSDNKDIAEVGSDGTITAKKSGTAKITATADGKTATCTVTISTEQIPATAIELNKATLDLTVGGNETLTATVTPSNSTDTVEWSSDKLNIATVDENGKVTAVAVGEATITAKAGNFEAKCTVTVKEKEPETKPVTNITIEGAKSVNAGSEITLTANVNNDATNKTVTWDSSDKTVATIDSNGKVSGLKKGTTNITATATDGSNVKSDNYEITVTVDVSAIETQITVAENAKEGVVVDTDESNVASGTSWVTQAVKDALDSAIQTATDAKTSVKTKDEATNAEEALKEAIQTFNNAKGVGTKVIVESLTVAPTELTMNVGDTAEKITATVNPSTVNVVWKSSNDNIAKVDGNGNVTAVAAGTATITATAGDKTATCTVTVEAATIAVTGVTLSSTNLELTVGGATGSLTATVIPSNATDKSITWTSSNEQVATVSNGTVTAVAAGSAKITVTTADGSKTAECTVTVKPSIAITATPVGSDISLSAVVTGGTATSYTWTIAAKEGSPTPLPTISGTNGTATVSTTGATPGTYTVTLTVTINGTQYTAVKDISVKAAQ